MRRALLAPALAAIGLLPTACGAGSVGSTSSSPAAAVLRQDLAAVDAAVVAGDRAGAQAALASLAADARQAQADGDISAERATSILAAQARLVTDLRQPSTPSPTASPSTHASPSPVATRTTKPPPVKPPRHKRKGHGADNG